MGPLHPGCPYMGVSKSQAPNTHPKRTRVLIIRAPTKRTPNIWKQPQYGSYDYISHTLKKKLSAANLPSINPPSFLKGAPNHLFQRTHQFTERATHSSYEYGHIISARKIFFLSSPKSFLNGALELPFKGSPIYRTSHIIFMIINQL